MRLRSKTSRLGRVRPRLSMITGVIATLGVVFSLTVVAPAEVATAAPVSSAQGIVKAAPVVGFNPENVISDDLFYDGAAMSSAEIQAFLDAKIGNCANGKCLNILSAGISSRGAVSSQTTGNLICSAIQGGSMKVSELIYRVQVACGISAKVILTTLQKEQGLATSKAPSDWNLKAAMGASCPDTAPCDPAFAGVGPQILKGTQQMKTYKAAKFGKQPGRNYIGYSPTASCGGTYLDIKNYATAALYTYTPYQPNAAALAAGFGLGNGCSAYGIRNFYNYYTQWFGSTAAVNTCAAPAPTAVSAANGLHVVNADSVNARQAPSIQCERDVRVVDKNKLLAVSGASDGWYRVALDGITAWIRADLLTPLAATPAPALALDSLRHVFALTADGTILAYPFSSVGRWGSAVPLAQSAGLNNIVDVGDIDGDGHRDLIGVDGDARPLLFRGTGSGLASPTRMSLSWAGQVRIVGAGDFDGDGIGDVFTVDSSGTLSLWRGDGAGSLRPAEPIGRGWTGMTSLAGGTDVTGDGRVDLVARTLSGTLMIYAGDGAGGWRSATQVGVGWGSMTALTAPGDFTGDGRADLIARDAAGGLHLYSGTAAGFTYLAQIGVGWQSMRAIVGPGPAIEAGAPVDVPRTGDGDLNGDGKADVVASSSQGLMLYPGNGSGGWGVPSVMDSTWRMEDRIVRLGDFTGDGIEDLGRIRSDGTFVLSPGAGDGRLATPVDLGNGWNALNIVIGGIDFDGDNSPDVIARDPAGNLLLYRGNGKGGWASGGAVIGTGWGMFDRIFAVGDFTGDGRADVMARTTSGDLWVYPTTGTGGWKAPVKVGHGWNGFTSIFSPGNFDGAGGPDLLARTAAGALWLYRGSGRGSWSGSGQIGVGWSGFAQIQ